MNKPRYPFLDLGRVNTPYMPEIEAAVMRVIASGRYVGGEECARLESGLKQLTDAPFAIGVSNGLDALRLILRAWVDRGDMKRGDEVIVAANTYIASILAIIDAGLRPVLAPVDMATLNLDTSRLDECVTQRTRAVMPVHLYGRVCWDKYLKDFVKRHQLLVIEDNAQAIGSRAAECGLFGSYAAGALGHAGAFSFYPTKNIGAAGDAGAVVTHDADLADRVRALANYGSDRRYHNIYIGANCRLDPVQAAVLNVKLPFVGKESAHRREIAAIYDRLIDNDLIIKPMFAGEEMVWHQYVVRCDSRDMLQRYLAEEGVATDIHYAVPPHRQPCMKGVDYIAISNAIEQAERIGDTVLSLPISTCTSANDAADIARIISKFSV
ncbi:MAG: DegT/DnrJ/EryC1/StrS family aminotransferase [Muribaculaceae bacterium]|nr:DegT/DnrJ/EryC1/StrS family aminotransferase [Muribaculaceae bacterium]